MFESSCFFFLKEMFDSCICTNRPWLQLKKHEMKWQVLQLKKKRGAGQLLPKGIFCISSDHAAWLMWRCSSPYRQRLDSTQFRGRHDDFSSENCPMLKNDSKGSKRGDRIVRASARKCLVKKTLERCGERRVAEETCRGVGVGRVGSGSWRGGWGGSGFLLASCGFRRLGTIPIKSLGSPKAYTDASMRGSSPNTQVLHELNNCSKLILLPCSLAPISTFPCGYLVLFSSIRRCPSRPWNSPDELFD